MVRPNEYLTHVVRLSCDHAESPMWCGIGPVDYGEAHLSTSLEIDLRTWEASFYAENDPFRADGDGLAGSPSAEDAWAYTTEGLALAERLAAELGAHFEVEADADPFGKKKARFRSASAATNPDSASSFRHRADQLAREFGISAPASGGYVPLERLHADEP